jgi:hypothetical protein
MRIEHRGLSDKISAVIGINEGYYHENDSTLTENEICDIIQKICEEYFNIYNIYISFTFRMCRVIYRTEWGCPSSGEIAFELSTSADPERYTTPHQVNNYNEHAETLIVEIAKYFKQSTVRIEKTGGLIIKNTLK